MDRAAFLARSETFGFDTATPWGLPAIRLLFAVPRAYGPLVEAWETRHPGTRAALAKMVDQGFVAYQAPVVVDTQTGKTASRSSRRVPRYRTTWRGHELTVAANEDIRILEERFPRTSAANMAGVLGLMNSFDLDDSHVKFGISTRAANITPGSGGRTSWLPERTAKWWVKRLVEDKYLRELDDRYADVREVVPEHWRVTRSLSKQLVDVFEAFTDDAEAWKAELRLRRTRYLTDIDPARVGLSGATDFDHDVECQRILAALFRSPAASAEGIFNVEPRIVLTSTGVPGEQPVDLNIGSEPIFYQPDAEMREQLPTGGIRRSIVEYERYQSRRDAWSHIERFLGYLHDRTLPMEPAVLRFVVDSERRERTYVELIEAFADYAIDHPERIPANAITLAVSSVPRVLRSADPLSDAAWFRVTLPGSGRADTECRPVLHSAAHSPYNDFFARTSD